MNVNEIKNGSAQRIVEYMSERTGKLNVTEEWNDKISALAIKQAGEIAKWVKGGKNLNQADILGKKQTEEVSALYRDFVESNGGKIKGRITNHNLTDVRAMASENGGKLSNKYTAAWRETFSPAFKSELAKHGVESAPVEQGGFTVKNQGLLDISL